MTRSDSSETALPDVPRISLIVLGPPTLASTWEQGAASAAGLLGNDWEVVLVTIGEAMSTRHDRLRVVNPSGDTLGAAMRDGTKVATGHWVVFVGSEQIPGPETAAQILLEVDEKAAADVVYFDDAPNEAIPAFVKPIFSPERLRGHDHWGAFVAYRRAFLMTIVDGQTKARGAELYDLALRSSRKSRSIANSRLQLEGVARALEASWCPEPTVRSSGTKFALEEHLEQTGGGIVEEIGADGIHRTRRLVIGAPLVSIVIPTGGTSAEVRNERRVMVVEAVRGIMSVSTYSNVEFVFVVDSTTPREVRDDLRAIVGDRANFVEWMEPFSFSGKMNLGVIHASGEFVLLLNDDIEVITPDWIESMLALAQLPGAGTIGTMLYFDDDTIQHAGQAYYKLDVTHIGLNSERGASGPSGGFLVEREVAGNTAACLMMTREIFLEAGGFSTLLPGNFNDVDLCMKVTSLGYQSYWTPFAELYHFESKSRDPRVGVSEIRTAWGRWEHMFYDSGFWPTDPHTVYARNR